MAGINLASLQQDTERKYATFVVEIGDTEVRMENPLRLPQQRRAEIEKLLDSDGEAFSETSIFDLIELTVVSKADSKRLLAAIGGDIPVAMELFAEYARSVKVGEALPSQD